MIGSGKGEVFGTKTWRTVDKTTTAKEAAVSTGNKGAKHALYSILLAARHP